VQLLQNARRLQMRAAHGPRGRLDGGNIDRKHRSAAHRFGGTSIGGISIGGMFGNATIDRF